MRKMMRKKTTKNCHFLAIDGVTELRTDLCTDRHKNKRCTEGERVVGRGRRSWKKRSDFNPLIRFLIRNFFFNASNIESKWLALPLSTCLFKE